VSLGILLVLGFVNGTMTGDILAYRTWFALAERSLLYLAAMGTYVLTSIYWTVYFMAFGPM
jgi:hypothetical protein